MGGLGGYISFFNYCVGGLGRSSQKHGYLYFFRVGMGIEHAHKFGTLICREEGDHPFVLF